MKKNPKHVLYVWHLPGPAGLSMFYKHVLSVKCEILSGSESI